LADGFTWVCLGGHHHLPIEGSSPEIGNRAHLATAIDTYLHSKHGEIAYATSDLPATEQPPPWIHFNFQITFERHRIQRNFLKNLNQLNVAYFTAFHLPPTYQP